jgi:hypothetical protein
MTLIKKTFRFSRRLTGLLILQALIFAKILFSLLACKAFIDVGGINKVGELIAELKNLDFVKNYFPMFLQNGLQFAQSSTYLSIITLSLASIVIGTVYLTIFRLVSGLCDLREYHKSSDFNKFVSLSSSIIFSALITIVGLFTIEKIANLANMSFMTEILGGISIAVAGILIIDKFFELFLYSCPIISNFSELICSDQKITEITTDENFYFNLSDNELGIKNLMPSCIKDHTLFQLIGINLAFGMKDKVINF